MTIFKEWVDNSTLKNYISENVALDIFVNALISIEDIGRVSIAIGGWLESRINRGLAIAISNVFERSVILKKNSMIIRVGSFEEKLTLNFDTLEFDDIENDKLDALTREYDTFSRTILNKSWETLYNNVKDIEDVYGKLYGKLLETPDSHLTREQLELFKFESNFNIYGLGTMSVLVDICKIGATCFTMFNKTKILGYGHINVNCVYLNNTFIISAKLRIPKLSRSLDLNEVIIKDKNNNWRLSDDRFYRSLSKTLSIEKMVHTDNPALSILNKMSSIFFGNLNVQDLSSILKFREFNPRKMQDNDLNRVCKGFSVPLYVNDKPTIKDKRTIVYPQYRGDSTRRSKVILCKFPLNGMIKQSVEFHASQDPVKLMVKSSPSYEVLDCLKSEVIFVNAIEEGGGVESIVEKIEATMTNETQSFLKFSLIREICELADCTLEFCKVEGNMRNGVTIDAYSGFSFYPGKKNLMKIGFKRLHNRFSFVILGTGSSKIYKVEYELTEAMIDVTKVKAGGDNNLDKLIIKPEMILTIPESKEFVVEAARYTIPSFSIDQEISDYKVSGKLIIDGLTYNLEEILSRDELDKYPHDIVVREWVTKTDVSFASVGLTVGDHTDSLTPDYLSVQRLDNGNLEVRILEIGTTRSTDLSRDYSIKKEKYMDAIIKRAKDNVKISYGILIVGPSGIITNLNVDKQIALKMVAFFNFAWKVKKTAIDNQILAQFDAEELIENKDIKQIFKNIKPFDGNGLLSKEVYEEMIKELTPEEHSEIINITKLELENIMSGYTDDNLRCLYRDCIIDRKFLDQVTAYNNSISRIKAIRDNYTDFSEKAVVQIPLILPPAEDKYNRKLELPFVENNDFTLGAIVKRIFESAQLVGSNLTEIDRLCLDPDLQYELNKKDGNTELKKSMLGENYRKYGLSRPKLTEREWTYLRQRGVEGKKAYVEKNSEIMEYRKEKKRWFTPDINTDDIEEFMKDPSHWKQCDDENYKTRIEAKLRLINKGYIMNSKAEGSDKTYNLAYKLLNTRLGKYCCFVSDLGAELASSMTEGLKQGQFRVKKLAHWKGVYLITKSTGKTGVIFYSIVFKSESKPLMNYCFKRVYKISEDLFCTDFVSDEKSSLDNKVKMESIFLSLAVFWREHYYLPPNLVSDEEELRAFSMLKLSLLVALEDKAKTEEAITLTRYIHAESLVAWPNIKDPGKMIEKLNICAHSRLEVWLNKKAIELCKYYISNDSFRIEDGQIRWDRFLNPYNVIDSQDFQTHEQVVNLMYIGYIKNKDQSGFANNSGQMLAKIVEKEDALRRTEDGKVNFDYIGLKEPPADKTIHEFSPKFLKYLCHQAKRSICKNRGVERDRYESMVEDDIIIRLKGISIDSLATLKKSSKFGPKYYKYIDYRRKAKKNEKNQLSGRAKYQMTADERIEEIADDRMTDANYHRITNVEAIMGLLKSEAKNKKMPNIVYLLGKSLKKLEDQECLHIDIFKKNQHGGLREIYVLEIDARIVQRVIEEISRAIVNNFESETMLHPSNKYIQPEREHVMCKKEFGNYVSYSTSDDASKWSQCHIVTKFIIMLHHLTPQGFQAFTARALSLWLDKKIKLNDELLDVFFSRSSEGFSDLSLNQAYNAFNGKENISWMKKGDSYVRIASGMMQGILHVTSSLLHVIYLDWLKKFCKDWINATLKHLIPDLDQYRIRLVRISYLVSSDDSSMTISFPTLDIPNFNVMCKLLASGCFKLKENLGTNLAIHKSIKSTTMTPNFYEFNSEFRFGSSEIKPFIKWVMACVQIVENESFLGIQEDFNSLLTKVLEGGGSIFLTAMCQLSQGILNYRMLGEGLSVVWKVYSDLMESDPDPTTGFFMMDPPLVPGMSGTKFQLWKTSCNTNMNIKFRYFLEESMQKLGEKVLEGTEFSGSLFSRTLFFSVGDLIRYRRLLRAIEFDPAVLRSLEEDPEVLYKPSDTVREIIIKIFAKVRMPGVASSLSGTNTFVSKVASSIYVLSRTVCTCKSEVIKELVYESEYVKMNPNVKISMLTYLLASSYEIGKRVRDVNIEAARSIIEGNMEVRASGRVLSSSYSLVEAIVDGAQALTGKMNSDLRELLLRCFTNRLVEDTDRMGLVSSVYKINVLRTRGINGYNTIVEEVFFCSVDSPCLMIGMNTSTFKYETDQVLGKFFDKRGFVSPVLSPDQRLYLFPLSGEYEEHERLISSYRISSELQSGMNLRLKTRLQQNLLWKPKEETPLLHVVQYKWFNIRKRNMDIMTFERIFSEAKNMYKWLSDNPLETLEKSHFNTQLEMFHFISRDPIRSRSIRINSAFIDPNNVTLEKVISRNFSNGLVPKLERATNFISKDNNRVMMHLLHCIFQFPFKTDVKLRMIADLLIGGPDLSHTNDTKGKKINSLKLIQEALKNNPDIWIRDLKPYADNLLPDIIFKNSDMKEFESFKEKMYNKWVEYLSLTDEDERLEFSFENSDILDFVFSIENEKDFEKQYVNSKVQLSEEVLRKYHGKSGYFQFLHDTSLSSQILDLKASEFAQKFSTFIREIRMRSVGIFGFYLTPQTYTGGTYTGKGIWMGNIGGTDVRLYINSEEDGISYLESIVVRNPNYIGLLGLLKVWCKDHNVIVKTGKWSSGECYDRIDANFRQIRTTSNQGCKIIVNNHIETVDSFNYTSMQLELSPSGIRLTVLAEVSKRLQPVTLLSCNLAHAQKGYLTDRIKINEDIKHYRRYPDEFKAYINHQNCKISPAFINHVLISSDSSYDRDQFIEWSSKLMEGSLLQKANIVVESTPEEIEVEEDDEGFQINFKEEDFTKFDWDSVKRIEGESILEFEEVSNMVTQLAKHVDKKDESSYFHPFFSGLIETIPSIDISSILSLKKDGKIVARVSEETFKIKTILSIIFGVDESRITYSSEQLFEVRLI